MKNITLILLILIPILSLFLVESNNDKDPYYQMIMHQHIRLDCRIDKGFHTYTLEDIIYCDNLANELHPLPIKELE